MGNWVNVGEAKTEKTQRKIRVGRGEKVGNRIREGKKKGKEGMNEERKERERKRKGKKEKERNTD